MTPHAAQEPQQTTRYRDLADTYLFFPVAIETAGTWNQTAVELVQEIGRRITLVTEDTRETVFCSSTCPLPFNEEMRSPSSARSLTPNNHQLQSSSSSIMRSDQPKPPAVAIVRQNGLSSASSRASVADTPMSRQIW